MNPTEQPTPVGFRASSLHMQPVAWVIAGGLILALPVLLWGYAHRSGDGAQQEIWFSNFVACLAQGEFYPRWLPEMNGGLGSPVFFFYPPASFYITSLFQPLLGEGLYHWRALGCSAALALVLSGVTAWLWLKESAGKEVAAVGAIIYMALPYHLAVDLHYRGALPELWTFVAMPLILFSTTRTVQRKPRAIPTLAVSYAFLVLTHPPTTLIFSWIPPVYALFLAPQRTRLAGLMRTIAGMTIGAGLAAIYLVPALSTQPNVSMEVMSVGRMAYANAFFFPHFETQVARDKLEQLLFWIVVATAGIGLCTWPWRAGRREHVFWTIVVVIATFMMFPVSAPIYEWVPLLPRIQFPWRFNTLLAVGVVALLPAVLQWLPARVRSLTLKRRLVGWGIAAVASVMLLAWTLQSYNPITRKPEEPSRERKQLNLDASEYRPHWATQGIRTTLAALGADDGRVTPVAIVDGKGTVEVVERSARRIVLKAETGGAVVEVRQFYYPGWEASLAADQKLPLEPSVPAGLIRITVPEGSHAITLRLRESDAEQLGRRLSLISALVVCGLGLRPRRKPGGSHGA